MVFSALLLLAVVITVHNDVKYRTLHPNTATAELLGVAPAAAAPKTANTSGFFRHFPGKNVDDQLWLLVSGTFKNMSCVPGSFLFSVSLALFKSAVRSSSSLHGGGC